MHILVTGASGYIGRHILKALFEHCPAFHVTAIDICKDEAFSLHQECTFLRGDICDGALVQGVIKRHNIDTIIHLAGVREGDTKANIDMMTSIVEASRLCGVKHIIFASSASVYDAPGSDAPIKEVSAIAPQTEYAWAKKLCEDTLLLWSKETDGVSVILRYFNVAGADPSGVFHIQTNAGAKLFQELCATICGDRDYFCLLGNDFATKDGTALRDFIHVSDLAELHIAALRNISNMSGAHIYNASTAYGYSVLEVVRAFEQEIGQKIPMERLPKRDGDPAYLIGDSLKAKSDLGWSTMRSDLRTLVRSALNAYNSKNSI